LVKGGVAALHQFLLIDREFFYYSKGSRFVFWPNADIGNGLFEGLTFCFFGKFGHETVSLKLLYIRKEIS